MLAAALSMRRFAYYFVVNVALLTGYLSWLILQFSGFRESTAEPVQVQEKVKEKTKQRKKQKAGSRTIAARANMAFAVIIIFFLVFFPNIGGAIETASRAQYAPSDAWCESLSWMRDNTPDPFGDPDFYYELYEPPQSGNSYNFPETAYGVTAWWDYGYWITRIGHRIPTSNPGTGHYGESRIFAAQDEASANQMIGSWNSRYVIVDYAIAMATLKFNAVATLSGSSPKEFYDVYYQPKEGELKPIILFYPEYYRSLLVRLYNFDGGQVVPQDSMVISFKERITSEGESYREIIGAESFISYSEAEAYVSSQESGNYRVVGINPFLSPVPLEALEHYKLIYNSDSSVMETGIGVISEVKIFEYVEQCSSGNY